MNEATKEWVDKGVVTNLNDEFHNSLVDVFHIIRSSPTLFFIDPFGPTYVHFAHLAPLLQRTPGITELIINFDTDGLYRIARGALSQNTNRKTAETFSELVTRIVGGDQWKTLLSDEGLTTDEGEEFLLNEYLTNLRRYMAFVVAYPIREALNSRPKYYFVFCTRHPDGLVLMNDFVRQEDDLIYGEHIESTSPLFQSLDLAGQAIETRRSELREVVNDYLRQNNPIVRTEMLDRLVTFNFGRYHSKDYRAVFKEFIDSKELTTADDKTKIDYRKYHFSPK